MTTEEDILEEDYFLYQADVEEGEVNRENARPIDFTNMDNKEVAKMLDILDHLKNGKRNEGRSTRNE